MSFFDEAYRAGPPPWDLGRPQPEVVALAEEGAFRGSVLDVGCGTGEHALFLAERGHEVTGVDLAPAAIERARAKAAARGLAERARFLVADALQLGALKDRFTTALDCGLFHVLDRAGARAYAASVGEVLAPGSELRLLCFSDEEPPGPGPRRVSEWDLKEAFRGVCVLTRIRPALLVRREGEPARAWSATLTRL